MTLKISDMKFNQIKSKHQAVT